MDSFYIGTLFASRRPMTFKIFLFLTSLGLALSMQAQERVSIQDPDLSFSYLLPKGWVNYDDDYYHYILNADSTAQITLTYFEGMCASLEDCYLGELEGKLRSEYTDFKVIYEKTGLIADVPAMWASFTGKMDGVEVKVFAFYLIKNDHFFKIIAFMDPAVAESKEQLVIKTIQSFDSELN